MELLLNKEEQEEVIRVTDPVTESNCYIIPGNDTCLVIDPGNFDLLEETLQKRKLAPSIVLLTHGHCDHIGGLNELRDRYSVTVIAAEACSEEMQDTRLNMSRRMEVFLYYKSRGTRMIPYRPFVCKPADLVFEDEYTVVFEERKLQMKALPGHTRGSTVILYGDRLFCGDYLLPEDQVVIRLPGGSEEEYEAAARPWLKRIPDRTLICPGHGVPYRMNEEVKSRHDLR